MKQILMMLALAALMGCEKAPAPANSDGKTNIDRALEAMPETVPAQSAIVREAEFEGVTRFYDTELGVTCYVFAGYKGGGISCLSPAAGVGAR